MRLVRPDILVPVLAADVCGIIGEGPIFKAILADVLLQEIGGLEQTYVFLIMQIWKSQF
ncbi:MAG: hypothetical protein ACJASL_004028 [Paraglaciecola sp.]|jgi:hypothetical protein